MRVLWKDSLSQYDKKERRVRIYPVEMQWIYLEVEVRRVLCRKCGKVKREKLEWLADNPFTRSDFACSVGRKCRTMTVKDVAKDFRLDWDTVKTLDKEYMKKQLRGIQ
ncbi:MAG: transposase family protein [Planctomycetia bacterium]|nr:transposase family protein [Planctomycetia bacterium]